MTAMPKDQSEPDKGRRRLLVLLPIGIIGSVVASLATAATRFLRPVVSAPNDKWTDVAPIAELSGTAPIQKRIFAEHNAGWAITSEQHTVYVLPNMNQALSAVCPHEGCEVAWDASTNQFACPCHLSYFAADGARIKGPARRGLDPLPTRIQNGTLQVQYQFFENNAEERITRA